MLSIARWLATAMAVVAMLAGPVAGSAQGNIHVPGNSDSRSSTVATSQTDVESNAGSTQMPVGVEDTFSTPQDTPLVVPTPGPLGNDVEPDGDVFEMEVQSGSGPFNGALTAFDPSGAFTYTPNSGFVGSDSFTYRPVDVNGGIGDATTVSITVTATAPQTLVANDDTFATPKNQPLSFIITSLLSNDQGFGIAVDSFTQPTHGSVVRDGDNLIYTPETDFAGVDSFTYRMGDGTSLSNVATVTIDVTVAGNLAPVAVDDMVTTRQETPIDISFLTNDTDPDGDNIELSGLFSIVNGGAVNQGNGVIRFTPELGFVGTASFKYTITDGTANSNVATVTIDVTANRPPVAVDDDATTPAGVPIDIAFLTNDADPDGDAIELSGLFGITNGEAGNQGNGIIRFVPEPGFVGTASFQYTITDGAATSNIATVTIDVIPQSSVNPPVANDDSFATPQDTTLTVTGQNGFLRNDSDPDGDSIGIVGFSLPSNGALQVDGDGGFEYTPDPGFVGLDLFTYSITDGTHTADAVVSIEVTDTGAVNEPPIANDDAFTTVQDKVLVVDAPGIFANDSDPEGAVLGVDRTSDTVHGAVDLAPNGAFTYTPDPGFVGSDRFTYRVTDGQLFSAEVTVTITVTATAANNPPVAENDTSTVAQDTQLTVPVNTGLLANDSDSDGDVLTVESVADPANGTLTFAVDGSFTYTPNPGFAGSELVEYLVSDGRGGTDSGNVEIVVEANAPLPSPSPVPSPSPDPSPEPSPSPDPSPAPSPSPEPSPDPSPSPAPRPDPVPSPDPSPSPSPVPPASPDPSPAPNPSPVPVDEPTPEPQIPVPGDGAPVPTIPSSPAEYNGPGQAEPASPAGDQVPGPGSTVGDPKPSATPGIVTTLPNTGAGEPVQTDAPSPRLWFIVALALAILAAPGIAIHRRASR
jgi:hypothetical protein